MTSRHSDSRLLIGRMGIGGIGVVNSVSFDSNSGRLAWFVSIISGFYLATVLAQRTIAQAMSHIYQLS